MDVAYLGNFRHRHCTESHIRLTLEDLGHRVVPLQEDEVGFEELERESRGVDLLLYTRTWGLRYPKAAIDLWRSLESSGVVTASYHLDLYLGLQREGTLEGDPFWATQYVFTPDGDPVSQAEFERRGINHHHVWPGVYKHECHPGIARRRFQHEVVFVGSYPYPHAEWTYRNELVDWLRRTYHDQFALYGPGTTVLRNEPLNDLYATARVVVGDSLCPGFTKPNYTSDRPFETVGRGGFLVMPWIEGLDKLMIDGEHLRYYPFGDFGELKGIIDWGIHNSGKARQLASRGQQHVRENHSYHERLTYALEVMGL